ncbi:patatin-like phospholipase family protein [Pseudoalteromonas gelatinilytica]
MSKKLKSALVVEGGAMRGIFAAGVLDSMQHLHSKHFDFVIGVSAGSLNISSWLANQAGRNKVIITKYCTSKSFLNFSKLFIGKSAIDLKWLWDITEQQCPIDWSYLFRNTTEFYVVTTSLSSMKAKYDQITKNNYQALLTASCSIPFLSKQLPEYQGDLRVDGGFTDSIPIIKAYQMGARDITCILSRPLGYEMATKVKLPILSNRKMVKLFKDREKTYNKALEFLKSPPSDCSIKIIAPPSDFKVTRFTKDLKLLEKGYFQGLNFPVL